MELGVFHECHRPQSYSETDAFDEIFAHAEAAERYGFDAIWLAEIHFSPTRSVLAAPLVIAAALAARTKVLKIGTAVHVLPLSNPLRTAEEAATVDHISRGRFEFGIGRSGSSRSYSLIGVPYEESQERLMEALDVMREAWKGRPFDFDGRYFHFRNANVSPRPLQRPHPPVRIAALNPASFPRAAELGLHIFVGLRGTDISVLRGYIESYHEAWRRAGHAGRGSVYLRIPLYASTTDEAAVDESRDSVVYYFKRQAEMARAGTNSGTVTSLERLALAGELATLTHEHILRERVVVGGAETLIARLRELQEQLLLDGIIIEPNPGGKIPYREMMRSLEIYAKEIAPALR
jgi:alkanesulfonate monooxygenase SsuD/methylene tetrahydromethanopterin reductase-like flavin-dependent oxidoreductase (luciferase family)